MRTLSAIVLFFSLALVFSQVSELDPRFHSVDETFQFIDSIKSAYPSFVSVETVYTTSTLGLPIIAVKISNDANLDRDKSSILIIAGQHARELLGTEVALWLMRHLLANSSLDNVRLWLDSLEIIFVPILNPDGRKLVTDSIEGHTIFWRKNMRDNNSNGVFDICDGVDPNRNFDFRWSECDDTSMCNEEYKGPAPFSDVEAQAVRDLVLRYRPALVLDLHSPDSVGGNKLWFCWYEPGTGYHPEAYPHYRNIAGLLANNTETEISGIYYVPLAAYNTKPKVQTWAFYATGTCAILMEITNKCFWRGDTIDTISARVGRGILTMFDRMTWGGIVIHASDSSGHPVPAKVMVKGVTDTLLPEKICNYKGRYHKLLDPGNYVVEVSYGGLSIIETVTVTASSNAYLTAMFPSSSVAGYEKDTEIVVHQVGNSVYFSLPSPGILTICDIAGRIVREEKVPHKGIISLENKPGVYLVRLRWNEGEKTIKIIVR